MYKRNYKAIKFKNTLTKRQVVEMFLRSLSLSIQHEINFNEKQTKLIKRFIIYKLLQFKVQDPLRQNKRMRIKIVISR